MKLGIILLTYTPTMEHPRANYAARTIRSVLDAVQQQGLTVSVHVADDGSPEEHIDSLRATIGGYACVQGFSQSNSARRGYGANYNLATQAMHAHCDAIMPLEEDWVLEDLTLPFEAYAGIVADPESGVGCVRLGYLGQTDTWYAEIRPVHEQQMIIFHPDSPEKHVFAGHPRIESVAWQRRLGPWTEGLSPQETELAVCGRRASREGVAFPTRYAGKNAFGHIGAVRG